MEQVNKIDRVYNDDKTRVAVLYTNDFGSGWSTWNNIPGLVFEPEVVRMVLDKVDSSKIVSYCEKKYPDGCFLGVDNLNVRWVSVGRRFIVTEYDGRETLQFLEDIKWNTA